MGVVFLPVRLSVTRVLCDKTKEYWRYFDTTRKGNYSSFLTPTVVGGQRLFRLKFAVKVTHPFRKRRLRRISAYNVLTVRYSKKVQL